MADRLCPEGHSVEVVVVEERPPNTREPFASMEYPHKMWVCETCETYGFNFDG